MGFLDSLMQPMIGGIIKFLQLTDWYCSLTSEQQKKLKEYSGHGEHLINGNISSSQTQKHLLWTSAINAVHAKDYEYAIFLAEKGRSAQGSLVDQHFIYNAFIEACFRKGDYENTKKYCVAELEDFSNIGRALKKDFDKELPPSIPCRDILLHIVVDMEKNYREGERLLQVFVQKGLLTKTELQEELQSLQIKELEGTVKDLLSKGELSKAKAVVEEIIKLDKSKAAEAYKQLGNYLLDEKADQEALEYFQKAIAANPIISGVKSKIERLAKKLGVQIESNNEEALSILKEKEKKADGWWSKRDLANEYVKLEQYEIAWKLFNEAITLCKKDKRSCDTIYPHMAKLLEKQNRYKDALFHYLLAYNEIVGDIEPPQYTSQGIDRCLKKLKITDLDHTSLYKLIKKKIEPKGVQELLEQALKQCS
jgi:tetratricopeptide (TPR) repeat protein